MHLKYTASATWREGETRAAIGWCSQWVECNQVTRGSDLRCYWLMRAVGGVSSARLGSCDFPPVSPIERVAGGELRTRWVMMRRSDWFSAAPRHTDEGKRETHHCTVRRDSHCGISASKQNNCGSGRISWWVHSAWCQHYYNIAATDIFWRGINALCSIKMGFPAQDWRIYVIITWGYRYQTTLISTAE